MSDYFGALEFPVQIPDQNEAIHDPALSCIGAYLAACLNDQLNPSWQAVVPGKKFVQSVLTNAPSDLFNERDLPALFVQRSTWQAEQLTDDITEITTDVNVVWVPHAAIIERRADRSTAGHGFMAVATRAIRLGRSPAWIDPLDSDPISAKLGSALMERAGLFRVPLVIGSRQETVTIYKGNAVAASYPCFSLILRIHETTSWDESFDSIAMADRAPSKLNETVTSGDFSISKLIPTT